MPLRRVYRFDHQPPVRRISVHTGVIIARNANTGEEKKKLGSPTNQNDFILLFDYYILADYHGTEHTQERCYSFFFGW